MMNCDDRAWRNVDLTTQPLQVLHDLRDAILNDIEAIQANLTADKFHDDGTRYSYSEWMSWRVNTKTALRYKLAFHRRVKSAIAHINSTVKEAQGPKRPNLRKKAKHLLLMLASLDLDGPEYVTIREAIAGVVAALIEEETE
jgi:hypothetical protein